MVVLGCLSWKIQSMLVHAFVSVLNCTFNIQVCNHSESWLFKINYVWNLKCFVFSQKKYGPFDCSINQSLRFCFSKSNSTMNIPNLQHTCTLIPPWPSVRSARWNPSCQHRWSRSSRWNSHHECPVETWISHVASIFASKPRTMPWWPNPHHVPFPKAVHYRSY